MKRWLKIILAVLIGLPLVTYGVGLLVPRNHVATMFIDLAAPREKVWALVSDVANTHKWRSDITAIRVMPGPPAPVRFVEVSSMGEVPFEVVSQTAPSVQVVRVIDDDQPFGGTWMWNLHPAGTGTRLSVTETGFVKSPIFRAMGLVFFSPTDTIESYLRALAKALGESAAPRS